MDLLTIEHGNAVQAQQTAQKVHQVLAAGGLLVFPTETVYGIGASVASETGCAALRRFKGRPQSQPFTVHLPHPDAAEKFVDTSLPMLQRLIRKTLPGPVSLVVEVDDDVIESKFKSLGLPAEARDRLYHRNTIGLRCPDHPVTRQILDAVDVPVVASSANRRDQPPPCDAEEAAEIVGDQAAMVIDGGRCRYARPSTIVRLSTGANGQTKVTVERSGVYDERFVRKLLRWTLLIVCSGNTCRSPMAQAVARQMLAEQRGIEVDDLEAAGIRVISAGTFAAPGRSASPEAVEAMNKIGIDLTTHRSQTVSSELIQEADAIYGMTSSHIQEVLSMHPSAVDKVDTLDPNGDIDDPIGSSAMGYQRCAELIRRQLTQRLKEQQP